MGSHHICQPHEISHTHTHKCIYQTSTSARIGFSPSKHIKTIIQVPSNEEISPPLWRSLLQVPLVLLSELLPVTYGRGERNLTLQQLLPNFEGVAKRNGRRFKVWWWEMLCKKQVNIDPENKTSNIYIYYIYMDLPYGNLIWYIYSHGKPFFW